MALKAAVQQGRAVARRSIPRSVDPWWMVAWLCVAVGVALRWWALGSHDLTFDEAFTGSAARRPIGELPGFLRESDNHPPLDYLLRKPFASPAEELWLRFPSAVWSTAALGLLAWWMRSKGEFGAFTVVVASFLPFVLLHGREARMYSLVMLLGVVASVCADRWLERPTRGAAIGIGAAGGLAALAHSTALVGLGAFLLLPGLRRDATAWRLRLVIAGSVALWALLWGTSFVDQASGISSFWIPNTTTRWLETVAAAVVSPLTAFVHISAGVLLIGLVVLIGRHPRVGRVAAVVFVLPFVALAIAGLELHVLLPRSLAFGAWAVAAALAALAEEARTRFGSVGALSVLVLIGLLTVPSALETVGQPRERHVALDELRARLQPGDRISISPTFFAPVVEWEFVAKDGFVVEGKMSDGRFVIADTSAPPSGRTHLLDHSRLPMEEQQVVSLDTCGEPLETASWLLRCVRSP